MLIQNNEWLQGFSSFKFVTCEFSDSVFEEFTDLLEQQATVDQYTDWISSLVTRCVIKVRPLWEL